MKLSYLLKGPGLIGVFLILLGLMAPITVEAKDSTTGIICDQNYVLCTSAICTPDPSNPAQKAICQCQVQKGESFGYTSCADRKPQAISNDVTKLISTYSLQQFGVAKTMKCPAGNPWSNCLDRPCISNPRNPKQAICTCDINKTEAFVTLGGNCNTATCGNGFWSGAVVKDYIAASKTLAKNKGVKGAQINFCPKK